MRVAGCLWRHDIAPQCYFLLLVTARVSELPPGLGPATSGEVKDARSQTKFSSEKNRLMPCLVAKNFQDSSSHRILRHMHEVLNIHKNKNYLHSSSVNRETNLLSLDTL